MISKFTVALCAASLGVAAAAAPALAAKPATKVFVRVEGVGRTLLADTQVKVPAAGSVRKGGAPKGGCSAHSAAGAFDAAVRGRWTGLYYKSLGGTEVLSVFGVKPPTKNDYWVLYVDGRSASVGMCLLRPKAGDEILFALGNGSGAPVYLRAPRTARRGSVITVTAGTFGAKGFKPAAGVTVTARGFRGRTGRGGKVRIRIDRVGTLVLHGSGMGLIRSPAVAVREL